MGRVAGRLGVSQSADGTEIHEVLRSSCGLLRAFEPIEREYEQTRSADHELASSVRDGGGVGAIDRADASRAHSVRHVCCGVMFTVTCPCNAIELTVRGKPLAQFFCHCDDCRKMTSGAYASESVYRQDDVSVTRGSPIVWTLRRNPRHFCGTCGGRMYIEVVAQKLVGVNGFYLPPAEFTPRFHVNCKLAVQPVRDDLLHYAGMPTAFGGSDECVDW